MEAGREAAPVFSYVKSRGLYAGVSILGQVFIGEQQSHQKAEGLCISVFMLTIWQNDSRRTGPCITGRESKQAIL